MVTDLKDADHAALIVLRQAMVKCGKSAMGNLWKIGKG